MKRVQIITKATFPEGMAATNKVTLLSKAFLSEGNEVEVVSLRNKTQFESTSSWFYTGINNGIKFCNILNFTPPKNSLINFFQEQVFIFLMVWKAFTSIRKVDVYYLYLDKFLPQLLIIAFSKLLNKKVVYEAVEYPYETEGDKFTKIPIVRRALQWLTIKMIYRGVDGFDVISENLEMVIRKQKSGSSVILRMPILVDSKKWLSEAKKSKRLTDKKYMFHAGSLSVQKDGIINYFISFIEAHKKYKLETGKSLYLGVTNLKGQPQVVHEIKSLLAQSSLEDYVFVTGFLSNEDLISYVYHANILLYNKPSSVQNKYNFPIKMADYLLADAPVVVGSIGVELNKYLLNNQNAIVVAPDDTIAMSEAIVRLLKDQEKSRLIADRATALAISDFDYRNYSSDLNNLIHTI